MNFANPISYGLCCFGNLSHIPFSLVSLILLKWAQCRNLRHLPNLWWTCRQKIQYCPASRSIWSIQEESRNSNFYAKSLMGRNGMLQSPIQPTVINTVFEQCLRGTLWKSCKAIPTQSVASLHVHRMRSLLTFVCPILSSYSPHTASSPLS